jgi:hypothetical protein
MRCSIVRENQGIDSVHSSASDSIHNAFAERGCRRQRHPAYAPNNNTQPGGSSHAATPLPISHEFINYLFLKNFIVLIAKAHAHGRRNADLT